MTPRVLVVEDEAIAAMAIRLMLESRGCTVLGVAASGQEAIDLAEALRPDLVLMDIRLRDGMSGIDSARSIQARRRIPVIFTTAYSAEEVRASCNVDDSIQFVSKPIQEEELAQAIATACREPPPGVQR
jgi:CheY-like chemotaxis protein